MATETERRFLVDLDKLPPLDEGDAFLLNQAYLSMDPTIRIRTLTTSNGVTQAYITVKGKGTVTRSEFEYPIPLPDALEMLKLAKTGMVSKFRHPIKHGGFTWELDRFTGTLMGLFLAEIELPTADTVFPMPPWIGREVTEDHRYTNACLAMYGLPRD